VRPSAPRDNDLRKVSIGAWADESPIVGLASDSRHRGLKSFDKFHYPCPIKGLCLPKDMTETHPQNRRLG